MMLSMMMLMLMLKVTVMMIMNHDDDDNEGLKLEATFSAGRSSLSCKIGFDAQLFSIIGFLVIQTINARLPQICKCRKICVFLRNFSASKTAVADLFDKYHALL